MIADLIFVLVEPQMGENIGAAARAMLNCGVTTMRLVNPRDPWPNQNAITTASGAAIVTDNVKVFAGTAEAIADCHYVLATTARPRDMQKPVFAPKSAAKTLRDQTTQGYKCAVLFGPERTGLVNDDLTLANGLITVPLNPDFSSLNLGQAVLLMAWEYWSLTDNYAEPPTFIKDHPATKEELLNFFERLEKELQQAGFYTTPQIKPAMIRNVRNMFQRADLTAQEVRTLHGIVTALKKLT